MTTLQVETVAPEDVDDNEKNPLILPDRQDTYDVWLNAQGIPIYRGFYIDIDELPLEHWELKGVPAAFVILEGTGGMNDAYVCEIPPGAKTKPQKHMYEETIYVTKGHGATTIWQKDGKKHTFEWGPGSLFAIPMNANYQHFNSSGLEGARFYAVTNCCFMMNLFHSVDYIFNNDYVFTDRFDGSGDYFAGEGKIQGRLFMTTNFVPDARSIKLYDYSARGKDSTNLKFNLAGQSMGAHVSEFPVGSYKKSHRHGPGAHLIILNGKGYSLLWEPGKEDQPPMRVEWKPGTIVVPPDQWFHQHFNSGTERVRYLAIHRNNWKYKPLMKNSGDLKASFTSVKEGGYQVEFEDEDPSIHQTFLEALHENGAECDMCAYFGPCPKKHA
jgi:quercetin dioxygenase-like cupin family protein